MDAVRALPDVGTVVDGYRVEALLNWSGRMYVYRVQAADGTQLAMKLLNTAGDVDDRILLRFEREIEIMSSINHANVVRIVDRGTHNGNSYLLMPFVDGRDLEHVLAESASGLDFETSCVIAEGLGSALDEIHNLGIVHRDVKLKNVFLTNDTQIKIGDFGIAIRTGSRDSHR